MSHETLIVGQARWRRLDLPGTDAAQLQRGVEGWRLTGRAGFTDGDAPWDLEYEVDCGTDWVTTGARINGTTGDAAVSLQIARSSAGEWSLNGKDVPLVAGHRDIDLAFTPATNLISLRRLNLTIGEEEEVVAAWLTFPKLSLMPLRQWYRRESLTTYAYRVPDLSFSAKLTVRPDGFVSDYAGLWREM